MDFHKHFPLYLATSIIFWSNDIFLQLHMFPMREIHRWFDKLYGGSQVNPME